MASDIACSSGAPGPTGSGSHRRAEAAARRVTACRWKPGAPGFLHFLSGDRLNPPSPAIGGAWGTRGQCAGKMGAIVLMNAIYDYHPAYMTGRHSDNFNRFSGL